MNLGYAFATISLACFLLPSTRAQAAAAIDRGEDLRRQREMEQLLRDLRNDKLEEAPTISPDEAVDMGPQSILRTRKRHRWFEVNLDVEGYYTDNMFFNESEPVDTVGSSVLTSSLQLGITPPEWKFGKAILRPRFGYQQIWVNYALVGQKIDPNTGIRKNVNDFDSQTAFCDITANWGRWQAQVGFDWQRLLSHQPEYIDYSQFYRDGSPRWSLSHISSLGERHAIIAEYLGSYHLTDVEATPGLSDEDRNDRTEHNLLLTYSYELTPKIYLQPSYRFQFTQFLHSSRKEQLHSIGGSITFLLTDWLFARAFVNQDFRESSDPLIPDYRKLDTGVSIGATFKF